jgi:hypothetical protein
MMAGSAEMGLRILVKQDDTAVALVAPASAEQSSARLIPLSQQEAVAHGARASAHTDWMQAHAALPESKVATLVEINAPQSGRGAASGAASWPASLLAPLPPLPLPLPLPLLEPLAALPLAAVSVLASGELAVPLSPLHPVMTAPTNADSEDNPTSH